MAKTRQEKEQQVQTLTDQLKEAKSVVFANFQGLSVQETEELRAQCREQDIVCLATKKTLMGRALKNIDMDVETKEFKGGIAAFFGTSDEVAPAQVVANFAKTHEKLSIFGGVLEGAFINSEKVKQLSSLPSKQEMLARLVGTINAPISGFVNVLAGNLRGLVTVLSAIKDNKLKA